MSEIEKGFFNAFKKLLVGSSIGRAVIYTIGHIIIASIAASCREDPVIIILQVAAIMM